MANYGRGWAEGYGAQSAEAQKAYADREAYAEGDWSWLAKSPRQKRLRQEQCRDQHDYVDDDTQQDGSGSENKEGVL